MLVALCALLGGTGCTEGFELPDWLLGLGDSPGAGESSTRFGVPTRPEHSTAHTETEVLSFKDVLFDDKLSREQRIEAFASLDPGALRTRVVPVNRAPKDFGADRGATIRPVRKQTSRSSAGSADRSRVAITMYSTSWCGVCKVARKYMNDHGISFVEHDVDQSPTARAEYLRLNPRQSVPTIQIDDEVLVGFAPQNLEAAIARAAEKRSR